MISDSFDCVWHHWNPRKTYNDNEQRSKNQKGISKPQIFFYTNAQVFFNDLKESLG